MASPILSFTQPNRLHGFSSLEASLHDAEAEATITITVTDARGDPVRSSQLNSALRTLRDSIVASLDSVNAAAAPRS